MYLFAATAYCPKETGDKQDFPTGFQLRKKLRFLTEPGSNGISLGSSRTAALWGTTSMKENQIKSLRAQNAPKRPRKLTVQQPAATKRSKAHQLNSSQTQRSDDYSARGILWRPQHLKLIHLYRRTCARAHILLWFERHFWNALAMPQ